MEMLAHAEQKAHQSKPKLPSPMFSFSQWVTLVFNTHTHTNDQTLVLLQMSHPPQADNYSVSDGVRWRVGCGTDRRGEGEVRGRVEQHNDSSPQRSTRTPPRQHARANPPPAVWLRAQEWQGDTGSFFMCYSSTPLQSNREQHLCFTTTHQPLTGRRRGGPGLQRT